MYDNKEYFVHSKIVEMLDKGMKLNLIHRLTMFQRNTKIEKYVQWDRDFVVPGNEEKSYLQYLEFSTYHHQQPKS
jgi:hypothetical protein